MSRCSSSYGSVFFFQAEDGIRDIGVTGVQTCALPISQSRDRVGPRAARLRGAQLDRADPGHRGAGASADHEIGRSEERRVGKECRSGWWADHEKKKEDEKSVKDGKETMESRNRQRKHE